MKKFEDMTGFKEIHPASPEKGGWREWVFSVWRMFLFLVDSLLSLIIGRVIPFLMYASFILFTIRTLMSVEFDELLVNIAVTTVFFVFILLFV